MDSTSENKPKQQAQKPKASKAELLSSAKMVAEAAKSSIRHENEKVDKGKVAGAAGNLLGAASHYGKLEEKSYGKYVEKAENYLHQYGSSHSATTTHSTTAAPHSTTHSPFAHQGSNEDSSGNKYGDYIKIAQGILKKH